MEPAPAKMTFLRISALLVGVAFIFGGLVHFVIFDYGWFGSVMTDEIEWAEDRNATMMKVRQIMWLLQPFYINLPLVVFFAAFFFNRPK